MTARPAVKGVAVDAQTRCAHWNSVRDVVAIKMRCCGEYYACRECHDALAGHPAALWAQDEWHTQAVLCGVCGHQMHVRDYLGCADACVVCGAGFNPGCRLHRHLYFETGEA